MGNKIFGYVLGVVGLIIMLLSYVRESLLNFLPASIDKTDVFVTGMVLVIIGVVLLYNKKQIKSGKVKQAKEEVPIYEGEGKHRKIVAYKKDKI
jgi:putative Mn2+ efflux pump MntP